MKTRMVTIVFALLFLVGCNKEAKPPALVESGSGTPDFETTVDGPGNTLTEEEAAHILGVTRDTLAAIRRRNGISYRRITKTKVLYHVDDISEYLDHQKVKAGFVSE